MIVLIQRYAETNAATNNPGAKKKDPVGIGADDFVPIFLCVFDTHNQ